jgi:hypothetical protein
LLCRCESIENDGVGLKLMGKYLLAVHEMLGLRLRKSLFLEARVLDQSGAFPILVVEVDVLVALGSGLLRGGGLFNAF